MCVYVCVFLGVCSFLGVCLVRFVFV